MAPHGTSNSHTIEISGISVKGLIKPCFLKKKSCYAQITIGNETLKTKEVAKSNDIKWTQILQFQRATSNMLEAQIYEKVKSDTTLLGLVKGDIATLGTSLPLESADPSRPQNNKVHVTIDIHTKANTSPQQSSKQTNPPTSLTSTSSPDENLPADETTTPIHSQANGIPHQFQANPTDRKASSDDLAGANIPTGSTVNAWNLLSESLPKFIKIVDAFADIHPYAKAALSILSAIPKAIVSQIERDKKLDKLAISMNDVYTFLCEAEQVQKFEKQKEILIAIAKQTEECLYFIQQFKGDATFLERMMKSALLSVDDTILDYESKFAALRDSFEKEAVLQTEILAIRILDNVEHIAQTSDLNEILYADGVRYSTKSGCLSGTREVFLDEIYQTLKDMTSTASRVVLLTGVAGSGKSSIASTVANHFDERERLGSSFFFNRSERGRNKADNVFSTIARDLADHEPKFRDKLWETIRDKKSLRKTHSPKEQFEQFILRPMQDLTFVGPIVIVIDALDECGDETAREDLLKVLQDRTSQLPPNIRIFLTGRPEGDIVGKLAHLNFVHHMHMNKIGKETTTKDITAFIEKDLLDVADAFSNEWPERRWLQELVDRAGELFVWAATACRFIRADGKGGLDPTDRLRTVLSKSTSDPQLSPIDDLYLTILRAKFDDEDTLIMRRFKFVMGAILTAKAALSVSSLTDLYNDNAEAEHAFKAIIPYLGSLVNGVAEKDSSLQILHISFADFLSNPFRSRAFSIDVNEASRRFTEVSLNFMNHHLKYNICSIEDSFAPNPQMQQIQECVMCWEALQYACQVWIEGLALTEAQAPSKAFNEFLSKHLLHWIEFLSLVGKLDIAVRCMDRLWKQIKPNTADQTLASDASRLLMGFGTLISNHALQVYDSALAFVPSQTQLYPTYELAKLPICRLLNRITWSLSDVNPAPHTKSITSIAFSSNGELLASYSLDRTVNIWDTATGKPTGEPLLSDAERVDSVSFSDDGNMLFLRSNIKTVAWNALTRQPIPDDPERPQVAFRPSVDAEINIDGWLLLKKQRILWIPYDYRGSEVKAMAGIEHWTVCIGTHNGNVFFIRIPKGRVAGY